MSATGERGCPVYDGMPEVCQASCRIVVPRHASGSAGSQRPTVSSMLRAPRSESRSTAAMTNCFVTEPIQ